LLLCVCAILTTNAFPEMTYTVSGGTLNPTHSQTCECAASFVPSQIGQYSIYLSQNSDCNPGIETGIDFLNLGFGIKKFVILGSQVPVSGLGLQNGRYFGIHSRLILCMRM